jgi:hypothetical protein
MGHYAWTSCRIQQAGKTMDVLAGQHQGSYWPAFGNIKETVQDRKKWRMVVERKTQNRKRTNVK